MHPPPPIPSRCPRQSPSMHPSPPQPSFPACSYLASSVRLILRQPSKYSMDDAPRPNGSNAPRLNFPQMIQVSLPHAPIQLQRREFPLARDPDQPRRLQLLHMVRQGPRRHWLALPHRRACHRTPAVANLFEDLVPPRIRQRPRYPRHLPLRQPHSLSLRHRSPIRLIPKFNSQGTLIPPTIPAMPNFDQHPAGNFVWFELSTTDQSAAKQFYSSLLG